MNPLGREFYQRPDVVQIARELLGKVLHTRIGEDLTSGIITEVEAYKAPEDKASHAYGGRRTKRTETMYKDGGRAYVYLCYGIHHLVNVVTGPSDVAHAVLIRSVQPLKGTEVMLARRGKSRVDPLLTAGPGRLSEALGIDRNLDGDSLINEEKIWITEGIHVEDRLITASPRVGIDYAEEWVDKPWRFTIKGNQWVSG
jgi:DNA-3-methyladenine glycosylase